MVAICNRDVRNGCLSWLSLVCPCRSHPSHPLPSVEMMGPADLGEHSGQVWCPLVSSCDPSVGSPSRSLENRKVRSGYCRPLVSLLRRLVDSQSEIRPKVSAPLRWLVGPSPFGSQETLSHMMATMLCIFLGLLCPCTPLPMQPSLCTSI